MNYCFCAFRMELSRRLRSRSFLVLLVLALLLSLAAVLVPGSRDAAVRVGLVMPDSGEELQRLLMDRSSELVRFVPTDEETLDRKVLTGQWDCGLVAHEDFGEKLENLDTRNLFTLKISGASTVYPLVQETVAACVAELTAPEIARDYLAQQGIDASDLDARLEALADSTQRVEVVLETPGNEKLGALDLTVSSVKRILRGLVGVLALLWGLYLTSDLGKFLTSDAGLRLRSVRSVTALLLPRLWAALLPVALWGAAVVLALDGWRASLALVALMTFVLALGLVIPRLEKLWQSVTLLMPFMVLGSFLLEPVLLDVHSLFPAVGRWLGWLPVTLYCRACDGQPMAALLLLTEAAVLAVAAVLLDRPSKRTRKK